MFVDEVKISVIAGRGGDGCLSFRREKYIAYGGPDGGHGGRGGSIIFKACRNVSSLLDLRKRQIYKAANGQPGRGHNRFGAAGEDLHILVPIGTIVTDSKNNQFIADLTEDQQEFLLAKGGRGGRGNKSFATPTHQTPREFDKGEDGENKELFLELKLIADIGLVGQPNAGKSTILARLSSATPRVADYPFTTLTPQLGLVRAEAFNSLVLADIPGLIAGAHNGAGLGIEFLRHIERTLCLAHVIDLVPADGSDPVENYKIVQGELTAFSAALASRPTILVGNKLDLPGAKDAADKVSICLGQPVLSISAFTGKGLPELKAAFFKLIAGKR